MPAAVVEKWVRYSARFPEFDQAVEFTRKHAAEFTDPEIAIRRTATSVADANGHGHYTASVEGVSRRVASWDAADLPAI